MNQPIEEKWKETRKELELKVGEALGEASMCWSETPKGVFESDKALVVANNLISFIENLLEQEKKRMSEEIAEMKTYTGGSSVNEKDKRVNKQEVLSIINK